MATVSETTEAAKITEASKTTEASKITDASKNTDVFATFVDSIPLATMVHTMDFRVIAANALCEAVLGCAVPEMVGRMVADFVPAADRASALELASELEQNDPASSVTPGRPIGSMRRVLRSDGSVLSCWMQVGTATIGGRRVIVACMDMVNPVGVDTARWRERAERDDLTGLLRRRPFLDRVEGWVQRDAAVVLAFVDVDRLKSINDSRGHHAGDLVLETAARRLQVWVDARASDARSSDAVVGRFAGDEFVVAVSLGAVSLGAVSAGAGAAGVMTAESLTADLRTAVCSEPVVFASELLEISVSIGAVERRRGEDGRMLVSRADALMYRDKAVRRSE